jgi:protein involved in sex pheromone biosynthesis
MRKTLALFGVAAVMALAGCGETATDSNGHSVITQPATQARNTVAQQNQQLQQMEQRTSQADPTQP